MQINPLFEFTEWQQRAFAAALLIRMWPNYKLFHESSGFGDAELLANQLDLVWQQLANRGFKFNLDVQLEKLEEMTPSAADFDTFVVYPALDFCSGMVCLLENTEDKGINCAVELSRLSHNSVVAFLEMLHISENGERPESSLLQEDPLVIWENEMQSAIIECIQNSPENKNTCQLLKGLVTEENLSNLGNPY